MLRSIWQIHSLVKNRDARLIYISFFMNYLLYIKKLSLVVKVCTIVL